LIDSMFPSEIQKSLSSDFAELVEIRGFKWRLESFKQFLRLLQP
jgi:hypothetical protein